MNRPRVLIVDDERPARQRLRRMIEETAPDFEIVGEAADGLSALEEIRLRQPDVVFLDIEMPELDGLALAGCLRGEPAPRIVFVTAYDQHALQAFEVAAVDYLVKPVAQARLRATLTRLRPQLERGAGWAPSATDRVLEGLREALRRGAAEPRRLATRSGARYVIIDPARLSAIIARDHYSALVYEGRELLSEESLDTWLGKLDPAAFLRVHRSAVVNLGFLRELQREGDRRYHAVLADGPATRVAISRERLPAVLRHLGLSGERA